VTVTATNPANIQAFGSGTNTTVAMDQDRKGRIFVTGYDGSTCVMRVSDDDGATWYTPTGGNLGDVIGTASTLGGFFIDAEDYAHLVYGPFGGGALWTYVRGVPTADGGYSWGTPYSLTGVVYAGPSSYSPWCDIVAFYENTSWKVVIASYLYPLGSAASVAVIWLDVDTNGTVTTKTAAATFGSAVSSPGSKKPVRVDFERAADGKSPARTGSPTGSIDTNVYVVWHDQIVGSSNIKGIYYDWTGANTWAAPVSQTIFTQVGLIRGFAARCPTPGYSVGQGPNIVFSKDGLGMSLYTTSRILAPTSGPNPPAFGSPPVGFGFNPISDVDLIPSPASRTTLVVAVGTVTSEDIFALQWINYSGSSWETDWTATCPIRLGYYAGLAAMQQSGVGNNVSVATTALGNPSDPFSAMTLRKYVPVGVAASPVGYIDLVDPTPADGAVVDVASGWSISFINHVILQTQQGYVVRRRRTDLNSGWEYWTGSTWVKNETMVTSTTATSVVFPSGVWDSSYNYEYGVSVVDVQLTRTPFEHRFVVGQRPLTFDFSVPVPVGQVSLMPTVSWAMPRAIQKTYQVKVFNSTTYGSSTFDPATSTADYASGIISDSKARYHVVQTPLQSGVTYKHYVQVTTDTGLTSAWTTSGTAFTISPSNAITLGQPTISAVADSTNNRIAVTLQAFDNKVTENQSGVEYDTTGFEVETNCTISRSTSQAKSGSASLQLSASSAATMRARTLSSKLAMPVVVGQAYKGMASFRTAVTARSCNVKIVWLDLNGTILSTSSGSNVTDSAAAWTAATVSATAPASAIYAYLVFEVVSPANAEIHYVDEIGLFPGSPTNWNRGGFVGVASFLVEASDDGGTTWKTVARNLTPNTGDEKITFYDHSFVSATARTYRARIAYIAQGAASAYSSTSVATATLTTWTLSYKDTDGVIKVLALKPLGQTLVFTAPETAAFFEPLGRSTKVRISDSPKGDEFTLSVVTESLAEYNALENVRKQMKKCMIITDYGEVIPVVFDSPRKMTLVNTSSQLRYVDLKFVKVAAPSWYVS
jgi:hypothetical protein